jgi:DNA-binding transcriptional MerR regulator
MTNGMRVGELAGRTGLTVRTLHHWDEVGLLRPGRRTAAGHRLYGPTEVRRLQKIISLRALGLGLDEIASHLDGRRATLEAILRAHRESLRNQRSLLEDLETRLDRILNATSGGRTITDDELLETMEAITMFEKYYTPEQLEQLKRREEALGPEAIQEAQEEWPRLISAVKEAMEKGEDPASPAVQELAQRWSALVKAFSGGDAGIEKSLATMYKSEPDMAAKEGLDPALFEYIGAAMRAGQDSP